MFAAFLVYFAGGYLLYAAMFAAVGSAVDNVQDSQQFQMPVTLPLVLGLIGMINAMNDPTGSLAFWLSIIPFTSPMVMVARIPYGVPMWEIALSVALLVTAFVAMVWLAGKIYRVGIFMYGKKPTFKELAKWITYR
jgi:ABC-2 type transport system permease protein